MGSVDQGALLLKKQLADLVRSPSEMFSAGLMDDDLYKWEVIIVGPSDTFYEGGLFKAQLFFPKDYPQRPPKMKFVSQMWHPNVHDNGEVCISILHEPGEDKYGYEDASERWLPIHTVESILISVISMLADPNDQSPANVDAACLLKIVTEWCSPDIYTKWKKHCGVQKVTSSKKDWRYSYNTDFKKKVRRCVRLTQDDF